MLVKLKPAVYPIETAPTDGRAIMLILKDQHGFNYPFKARWKGRWETMSGRKVLPEVVGWKSVAQ